MNHQLVLLVISGIGMGCLFKFLNIPGGCMLGAVIGSMAVKLLGLAEVQMPSLFYNAAQIGIGVCVGSMLSIDMLVNLKNDIPVMLLSTGILLAAGLVSAFVVRHMTDIDVIGSILSTSPGGLNAVIGLADSEENLPKIMAFQMTRLYIVILMVPVFCWCMRFFSINRTSDIQEKAENARSSQKGCGRFLYADVVSGVYRSCAEVWLFLERNDEKMIVEKEEKDFSWQGHEAG